MKAIVWTKYGPPEVLQLQEVEKPTPKDDEVRIRIYATTVTAGDCELRSLNLPIYISLPLRIRMGFRKPKENTTPGTELAGVIEAVGKDVTLFKVGDQVFGAATVPFGGRDALHFLRLGNIKSGQKVLINGAGGSIGTFAVQLAKHYGAEVTAVDSVAKLDMLSSLGADHVIDYTQEDFTENGEIYDVIFDVVGKLLFSRSNKALKENGTYLLANPVSQIGQALWARMTSNRRVIMQTASGTIEDLTFLRGLIEDGKIKTVIDRRYPLEQTAEAHRYVETGQKKGNVVITVGYTDKSE